jgi:hypothetical protein
MLSSDLDAFSAYLLRKAIMMKLTQAALGRAKGFMQEKGRPVDQALFAYHFENGAAADVVKALATYQNEDGGFGRALEADLRLDDSSAIATSVAFQILRQIGAGASEPVVRRGIDYLLATYDASAQVWPIIPAAADTMPRAPWWDYAKSAEGFSGFKANPRAELVGYLLDYAELVDAPLLAAVLDDTLQHLDGLPSAVEMHDFNCYRRLADTRSLAPDLKQRIWDKLSQAAGQIVDRDTAKWAGYAVRPLGLAPVPGMPVADALGDELLGLNLDYEIQHQNEDGSWSPFWSWFGAYPEEWHQAKAEWESNFVVNTLLVLRAYGRLDA